MFARSVRRAATQAANCTSSVRHMSSAPARLTGGELSKALSNVPSWNKVC